MNNHKHSWVIPEGRDNNDITVCEKCGVDYDEWHDKMIKKGYTEKQLKRFQDE